MAVQAANTGPAEITAALKREAKRLGFELAGACTAVQPPGIERFRRWLAAGYAGQMRYLPERADAYASPHSVLAGARSILMLGMSYRTEEPAAAKLGRGRVSRYAWGEADYHDVIHERLRKLAAYLRQLATAKARGVVDTAPLLERDFAQLAGLGWIGKNTLLLNRRHGSWLFLAALLTDLALQYDTPYESDHCGTCRECLDHCPTDAFPQPYVLDASKCISYLTIELRDAIPAELRSGVGEWLFGCDVCQDVCPWNRRAAMSGQESFRPAADLNRASLTELFSLSDQQFRDRFRHSPLWRAKRHGILRNAAIVLGNQRSPAALSALTQGLQDEASEVRTACQWAIEQIRKRGQASISSPPPSAGGWGGG